MRRWLGGVVAVPMLRELAALRRLEGARPGVSAMAAGQRVGRLLRFASSRVPAYQRLGLNGAYGVNTNWLDALRDFPVLDRSTLKASYQHFVGAPRGRAFVRSSGGATGEPSSVLLDTVYLRWNRASKVFFDAWAGYAPGECKVTLWGARQDTVGAGRPLSRLARWLRHEIMLDAYNLNEPIAVSYLEIIREKRPRLLLSYAESADELVRFARRAAIPPPAVGAVMATAGTLYEDMRREIEGYFRAPVFNRYGAREVGDIACECAAHEGLHVNPLTHYVELIKPDGSLAGPGETGDVVVTLLTNYAMPLIRYRIGDVATWAEQPCSCGLDWPLLKAIEGRVTDHFVTASGGLIFGGRFRALLFDCDFVSKYQWVQESRQLTRLRVVLDDAASDWRPRLDAVAAEARRLLGDGVRVEVKVEPVIELGPTGKHRFTISKVERTKSPL